MYFFKKKFGENLKIYYEPKVKKSDQTKQNTHHGKHTQRLHNTTNLA